jgi:hypothetical protein
MLAAGGHCWNAESGQKQWQVPQLGAAAGGAELEASALTAAEGVGLISVTIEEGGGRAEMMSMITLEVVVVVVIPDEGGGGMEDSIGATTFMDIIDSDGWIDSF